MYIVEFVIVRKAVLLRNIVRFGGILLLTAVIIPAAHAGETYMEDVAAAATDISQGGYDLALNDVNSALVRRSDDPLAHIALGTALLHTNQINRALKEFTTANNLVGGHPLALYGMGLCDLALGEKAEALDRFKSIKDEPNFDPSPVIAYIGALSGDYQQSATATDNAVLSQIAVERSLAAHDYTSARKLATELVKGPSGSPEQVGALVTFDPDRPVALTAPPLTREYKSPADPTTPLKRINGLLTLRANLKRADDVVYVIFYIDDKAVSIVNHHPYECQYDTRKLSNSAHVVKIEGRDAGGSVISTRSVTIAVFNRDSQRSTPEMGDEAAKVEQKLWESLQLKPSRRVAYYALLKCAEAENDRPAALAASECVVAMDPTYKDARCMLLKYYCPVPKYREVWRVKTTEKVAAITFDDGPSTLTPQLLKVLADKNVKATFFVVGMMAEANPTILQQMANEGHEIESHTYSHRNLEYISDAEIEREFMRNQATIRSIIGRAPHFFRAPGGHHNGAVAKIAAKYGLSQVMWTVNCGSSEGKKPQIMLKQVNGQTNPGSIILMHNVETITLMALPDIIDSLRAKGYKLVTLGELLQAGDRAH